MSESILNPTMADKTKHTTKQGDEEDTRSRSGPSSSGTKGTRGGEDDDPGETASTTSSKLVETEINMELKPLDELSETEFNKLTVGQRKLAKNIDTVMGNLEVMKEALFTFSHGHNKLVKHVVRNTNQANLNAEQVDVVDNELGHLVGQVVDMQRAINVVQNESVGIKNELYKKDLALDIVEKEVRKKNLVISGLIEELNENIYTRALRVLQTVYNGIQLQDIDCIYRVGVPSTGKTREVIVELFSKYVKEDILKGRTKLRENEYTRNIWINEDLPTRTRKSRGVMRDIVRRASELGTPCAINGEKITCNNMTYNTEQLKALPKGLRPEDMKTRKEGKRIGFMSEDSFLSNYYLCPVTVDGYTFCSAEHAIQYKRSIVGGREDIGIEIKQTLKPSDAKMLGERVDYNKKWDSAKIGIIRGIVKQKFVENNRLKLKLLETSGFTLEESTFDRYWGTGIPVYSREFKRGRYTGKNIMGRMLEEIRDEFLPKRNSNFPHTSTPPASSPDKLRPKTPTVDESQNDESVPKSGPNGPLDNNQNRQTDGASRDGNQSTTSLYIAGMSESVLKSMLLGLKNTNTGPEVQQQIIMRLGEISAGKLVK